ncbi:universal stress protein [Rhodococcus sp. UNC363MFTsu5.1]|uniref:universal stress protein n=1 Tax=Rhodococcus sp. UNC363MFTsu5.1 TaxID=1449069 RepID=UPI000691E539|nr:universal stress protein [Rhodococcus sp. UNC363MFTsu5.1]
MGVETVYNPHRDEPFVVGIDGSDQAVRAAEWATVEAVGRRVELHLVYVIAKDELERRYAERVLAFAEAAARGVDASVKVESRIVRGPLVPTLRAQTESANALVLGSVGMGFIRRAMVGSTASALAAGAACPVVVVRGSDPDSAPPSTGPVLTGLGGHHIDDALLGSAMHEASIRHTHVLAVRAAVDLMPDLRRRRALEVEREFDEEIRGRVERWHTTFPGIRVDTLVVQDTAAESLTALSANAQMIVVGSRGRGFVEGAVLGSTSQSLLLNARCPILVYREPR